MIIESGPTDQWVVIDEVQEVPALPDEVHRLIEDRGRRFLLSGSSARKLRRGGPPAGGRYAEAEKGDDSIAVASVRREESAGRQGQQ